MSVVGKSGYKETVIGWVPTDWQISSIRDAGEIVSGGTPSTSVAEYWDGEINWCTPTDITRLAGSRTIQSTERKITNEGLRNSGAVLIKKNSLLVCTRATIGICAINTEPTATNQGFKSIIPNESFTSEYLYYAITNLQSELKKKASGSTFLEINKAEFEKILICRPPLIEQQNIADILTAADDKLDVISRQIEATKTLKQGLMQTLFSQGVGTQDANGNWVPHTEFKGSELGDIPVGWEVRTLESVATVERGKFSARPRNDPKYFENGDIPFIQTGDIASASRYIENASQFLNADGLAVSKRFPPGTIFITIAANIGDVAIAKIPMTCPDSLVGIKASSDACDNTWLYYQLANNQDYFDSKSTQNAQKNINLQVLKPFLLPLPSLKEQQRIAGILTALDDKLEVLLSRKNQYQTLKRGLMQKLLTGEWRIKLDSPTGEA